MTNNQPQFDAFLAHNSLDKYLIRQIKTKLENLARDRNLDLKLWLDEEQIGEDGVSFHIKQGISQSRCVVFFIGLNLLGKWGLKLELQIAEQLAIESDLKLIPVLLPGVQKMPDDPIYSFLKTKLWINFNSIDDAEALDKLFGRIPKSREIKVPEQRVNQIPKISPKDYTTLEKLLSKGRWEVANNLTYQLMVKVVGQNNGYKLTDKDLKNFPCEDLLKIDSLWVKHSQGKFGFSVQKTIYLSVGG
ncbi:GUN4 domain-containing protein [Dolichospermum sp. ST_sed9]|nr:GUN4 domain-containing protein [Dolichospermum sp. ST_sed9]